MPPSVFVKDGKLYRGDGGEDERQEERRCVALDAAARFMSGRVPVLGTAPSPGSWKEMLSKEVVEMAKRFEQYLEKGE